ncbi:MAG: nucleoside triphosphate pyrophosphohydrolase [Clostridiales bacterium]|jgi:tetrapyrrole methylase family protein/MazG family protein|nr:nucleoside triphosphate pyrophosphohydrolase [Clostridiales bacterium]
MDTAYSFDEFMDIIRRLRGKDGCPWDREQTHESLRQCLLEESYEVIEAINNKDRDNLCEELGDVLLQVAMHSVIAEEENKFAISDVIAEVSKKMIRRHPHVFGDTQAETSDQVLKNWEDIKSMERDNADPRYELKKIPKALPANIRAEKTQKKAVKYGLELGSSDSAISDIIKGLEKLNNAVKIGEKTLIFDEFGYLLFHMIKLSLVLQINAENSLTNATNKFINRLIDMLCLNDGKGYNLCDIASADYEACGDEK